MATDDADIAARRVRHFGAAVRLQPLRDGAHHLTVRHGREELVGDLRDHGPPWAIVAREAVVVDRLQPLQVICTKRKSGDA